MVKILVIWRNAAGATLRSDSHITSANSSASNAFGVCEAKTCRILRYLVVRDKESERLFCDLCGFSCLKTLSLDSFIRGLQPDDARYDKEEKNNCYDRYC